MASSCGPFHAEALRRQRVIDKKHAAKLRLAAKQEEESQMLEERVKMDEEMRKRRHEEKMQELQQHLSSVKEDGGRGSKASVMGIPRDVYKQMKAKEKMLRNNNLNIGHPRALWEAR